MAVIPLQEVGLIRIEIQTESGKRHHAVFQVYNQLIIE